MYRSSRGTEQRARWIQNSQFKFKWIVDEHQRCGFHLILEERSLTPEVRGLLRVYNPCSKLRVIYLLGSAPILKFKKLYLFEYTALHSLMDWSNVISRINSSYTRLTSDTRLTILSLGASAILGSTGGSGSLRGMAARDLSCSSIVMRVSDMDFWFAVRRMIPSWWSKAAQIICSGKAAQWFFFWSLRSVITSLSYQCKTTEEQSKNDFSRLTSTKGMLFEAMEMGETDNWMRMSVFKRGIGKRSVMGEIAAGRVR